MGVAPRSFANAAPERIRMTLDEWRARGVELFGEDMMDWQFVCPACGHVASGRDWKDAGAREGEIAYSCIGRRTENPRPAFGKGPGPCDYAGGGLIGLNPVTVVVNEKKTLDVFAFAAPGGGS